MGFQKTNLFIGIVLLGVFSDVSNLWPILSSDKQEFTLALHSEFNITCFGERSVTWLEPLPLNSEVHSGFNHSTLVITDAQAWNTRYYPCGHEDDLDNLLHVYIFVPDPEVPFVSEGDVENADFTTIPCRTTNPYSHVILRDLQSEDVLPKMYDHRHGFMGSFSPGHYVCETTVNGKAVRSIVYNVTDDIHVDGDYDEDADGVQDFSINLSSSSEDLKEGDALNLTCETPPENYFHLHKAVLITLSFPDKVRHILSIPTASVADTGRYECSVTNQITGQTKSKSLGITVHESSFVEVISNGIGKMESVSLLEEKEFTIYIDADPTPKVRWFKDGLPLDDGYISSKTTHLEGLRYENILVLHHPIEEDSGVYEIVASTGSRSSRFSFKLLVEAMYPELPKVLMAPIMWPQRETLEVSLHSTFRLTCRGQEELSWHSPVYIHDQTNGEKKGLFISTLTIANATAAHTGEYVCYYDSINSTEETSIYIYVPDPQTPFVPSMMTPFENHVMTSHDQMEIPCRVTDPSTSVSLIHVETGQVVPSVYDSRKGFVGLFSGGTYVCRALVDGNTHDSIEYIVHGWTVGFELQVDLRAEKKVLLQGETITVHCVAKGKEMLEDHWKYPGKLADRGVKSVKENKRDVEIIYTLTVTNATPKDSGIYACSITDILSNESHTKQLSITVYDHEFVRIKPVLGTMEAASMDEVRDFKVDIEAFPTPKVTWFKDELVLGDVTAEISTDLIQTSETSYQGVLNLIRAKAEDSGNYTMRAEIGSLATSYSFYLHVKVPPVIVELRDIHHSSAEGQEVVCSAAGSPPPDVDWYICKNIKHCANDSSQWMMLPINSSDITVKIQMDVDDHIESRIVFQHLESTVAVRCLARNDMGAVSREVKLVSSVLVLLVIVIISLIVLVIIWKQKPRYEIRWRVIESVSPDGHEYIYVDPMQLPYDSRWEFPRDGLVLGESYVILSFEGKGDYMDMKQADTTQYVPMLEISEASKYSPIQRSDYDHPPSHRQFSDAEVESLLSDDSSDGLTTMDLLSFTYQVARGMEFLASKNCYERVNHDFLKSDHPAVTRVQCTDNDDEDAYMGVLYKNQGKMKNRESGFDEQRLSSDSGYIIPLPDLDPLSDEEYTKRNRHSSQTSEESAIEMGSSSSASKREGETLEDITLLEEMCLDSGDLVEDSFL
ncbi:hypothetical protein DNTS_013092 [Danionella cerebrum]|uniref:Platelet-derived growth factor receptor-like protein n=1 Tax=Danionella cerebrum TaxID=2873325 RepID=A0A553QY98_9TELE|nr:hypothetical protein DNTS_013092 [Danionella translucida]